MSEFQQQALKLAAQQAPLPWLQAHRAQAADAWSAQPWPSRKTEHWKYTPLHSLQKELPQAWGQESALQLASLDLIPLDATRLVFVNGIFSAELSTVLPEGVVRFSQANTAQQTLIQQQLGKVVEGERHLFATLNNAWVNEGVLVHVPRNQQWHKPVYVVHASSAQVAPAANNARLLVVLEAGASATLIEQYTSTHEAQNSFVNALSELVIGDNASLNHYRLNLEQEQALHIGAVHADLQRSARLRAFTLALGSRLQRIDYQLNHRGSGAELDLQGLYLPRHQQLVDYHTNVCHWVPHCTSNEVFRGIVGDSAQAVFNGRIYIHENAQKTLAELSNKNLLTSNKAEINTKPELEIYADDVKCAHGATVSQLNAQACYYLQSRGVSRQEAEVMLSFGFVNELLEQIAEPAIHDYLLPRLAARFGRDQALLADQLLLTEAGA